MWRAYNDEYAEGTIIACTFSITGTSAEGSNGQGHYNFSNLHES